LQNIPAHLLGYFKADVLALYVSQPDRYDVHTDYFSGHIQTSSDHYQRIRERARQTLLNVKFGFRTLVGGELALAVWMPDLSSASPDEQQKWLGFRVSGEALGPEPDSRFDMWVQRYIEGSWDIEDGVLSQLGTEVRELNAVSFCVVGKDLFASEAHETLCFPTAQNNHRFHDAHSEVYKFLIDGLNRTALEMLAEKLRVPIRVGTERTLKLLNQVVPKNLHGQIFPPLDKVSMYRRLADHQLRPKAEPMRAFEEFNADMAEVVRALRTVKGDIAARLGVTVESCVKRRDALTVLYPEFDTELKIEPNYPILEINKVVGRTITRVEVGFRRQRLGAHNSELIILHFDDDSSIAIHTGSNIMNLEHTNPGLRPEELNVSFLLNYVPPLIRPPELAE
jgi:hypothetical protein